MWYGKKNRRKYAMTLERDAVRNMQGLGDIQDVLRRELERARAKAPAPTGYQAPAWMDSELTIARRQEPAGYQGPITIGPRQEPAGPGPETVTVEPEPTITPRPTVIQPTIYIEPIPIRDRYTGLLIQRPILTKRPELRLSVKVPSFDCPRLSAKPTLRQFSHAINKIDANLRILANLDNLIKGGARYTGPSVGSVQDRLITCRTTLSARKAGLSAAFAAGAVAQPRDKIVKAKVQIQIETQRVKQQEAGIEDAFKRVNQQLANKLVEADEAEERRLRAQWKAIDKERADALKELEVKKQRLREAQSKVAEVERRAPPSEVPRVRVSRARAQVLEIGRIGTDLWKELSRNVREQIDLLFPPARRPIKERYTFWAQLEEPTKKPLGVVGATKIVQGLMDLPDKLVRSFTSDELKKTTNRFSDTFDFSIGREAEEKFEEAQRKMDIEMAEEAGEREILREKIRAGDVARFARREEELKEEVRKEQEITEEVRKEQEKTFRDVISPTPGFLDKIAAELSVAEGERLKRKPFEQKTMKDFFKEALIKSLTQGLSVDLGTLAAEVGGKKVLQSYIKEGREKIKNSRKRAMDSFEKELGGIPDLPPVRHGEKIPWVAERTAIRLPLRLISVGQEKIAKGARREKEFVSDLTKQLGRDPSKQDIQRAKQQEQDRLERLARTGDEKAIEKRIAYEVGQGIKTRYAKDLREQIMGIAGTGISQTYTRPQRYEDARKLTDKLREIQNFVVEKSQEMANQYLDHISKDYQNKIKKIAGLVKTVPAAAPSDIPPRRIVRPTEAPVVPVFKRAPMEELVPPKRPVLPAPAVSVAPEKKSFWQEFKESLEPGVGRRDWWVERQMEADRPLREMRADPTVSPRRVKQYKAQLQGRLRKYYEAKKPTVRYF